MTEIMKTFEICLKSEMTCKEILDKMNSVCNYEINQNFDENSLIQLFLKTCAENFYDEFEDIYSDPKKEVLQFSSEDIFQISHQIIKNKEKYEKNSFYESIEFFYQTFFFYEFTDENESNDFIFIGYSNDLLPIY